MTWIKHFNKWIDSMNDAQTAFLRRMLVIDAKSEDPGELLAIAFCAGWRAARQRKQRARKHS